MTLKLIMKLETMCLEMMKVVIFIGYVKRTKSLLYLCLRILILKIKTLLDIYMNMDLALMSYVMLAMGLSSNNPL